MRAIIYCRVSSDPRQKHKSVDEQERDCRAVAQANGWDVGEVLVDNDRGASRYSRGKRPAYIRLREILRAGDVLVTWEASRAQRDLAAYLELRELCAERGVLWSYSGRVNDLARGDDRFTTGLDALLAEREVEQTRDRVLRGVRANAAAGKPHGKLPYGYMIVRDPATGESVGRIPNPETAPIVREIVSRILAGDALYSICRDLNNRGIPGPRPKRDGSVAPWISVTLRKIADSPTYAGLRVHKGEVLGPATWEPLITMNEHQRLLALLADPTRLTHRGSDPKWLLSGIATCAVCGAVMRRQKNRGFDAYICKVGFCVSRGVAPLDELVIEALLTRLESVDPREFVTESPETTTALREARELRARLDDFTDRAAEGELSGAALARIEARLLPQIASAERRASVSHHPVIGRAVGPDARSTWESMDMEERRALVRGVMTIRIARAGQGKRQFDPDDVAVAWRM